jgi:hypothetical protein
MTVRVRLRHLTPLLASEDRLPRRARAGDSSPARTARPSSHGAGSNGRSPLSADLFTGLAISVFWP